MSITFNNVTYAAGYSAEDDGAVGTVFQPDNVSTSPITVNGTVSKVGDAVTVTGLLPGSGDTGITTTTTTLYVSMFDTSGMIAFSTNPNPSSTTGNNYKFLLSNPSNAVLVVGTKYQLSSDPNLTTYQVTCFVGGTLIRTVSGDVAVEDLAVGDLAVTASGEARPIVWIGQRTIECARHPRANEVLPIRIAAHAFAENRPARDLVVSPGHSIAVDLLGEVLIPASSLINGTTIRQESFERVTYWHVELESHDLLVAENLPTESYLDMGNRGFFPRPGEPTALHGVPDGASAGTHADFCRPFHEAGPMVDFVRARLAARVPQLDWVQIDDPLADLHLIVDGRRIEPEVRGLSVRFLVPATAEAVWLVSDTVVPAITGGGADPRSLGVCVGTLVVDDGFETRIVAADDPSLGVGFHDLEQGPQRWTAGRALLPASLWEGCRGSFFLRVELTRSSLSRWVRTEVAVGDAPVALAG